MFYVIFVMILSIVLYILELSLQCGGFFLFILFVWV